MNEDRQVLIEKMLKQVQAKLKEAQVTTVCAMDNLDPTISFGKDAQVHDPDISQAGCNHQAR